ncbi:MAG: Kelch repeat-containing protein [Chthoniobacterales bacterium]
MKIHILLLAIAVSLHGALSASANTSVVLNPERGLHTGTLLDSGKVLIAGGATETAALTSALLYDRATNTLSPTGSLLTGRSSHTATKLANGQVLVTGGSLLNGNGIQSAEIYDPATGTFSATANSMTIPRTKHTANLLADGSVLIVGGTVADLYNPTTRTFSPLASTPVNRSSHSAVTLADGSVLISGGYVANNATASAEIYNPSTMTFSPTANSLVISRANHQMTLMPATGKVLVTGGFTGTSPQEEVDIYDPVTKVFTASTPMNEHRSNHRALLLPDGQVIAIGGTTLESGFLADNEIFNPATQSWTFAASMNQNRSGFSANLLLDGTIFVAGGATGSFTLKSAEIINPSTRTFTKIADLKVGRNQHTANLLPNGKVLLAGGSLDADFLSSVELFDPITNSFALTDNLLLARKSHTGTLLSDNNRVLIAGGKIGDADTREAEIYDIALQQFRVVGSMSTGRSLFTATRLQNGQVLMAAGRNGATPTATAELFNPSTETFSDTGSLNLFRKRHKASLLNDGTVLISGGAAGSNGSTNPDAGTPTCEIYNPTTGTFAYTPEEMNVGRTEHDSTLLVSGEVLITGGNDTDNFTDLFNPPPINTFSTVGSLVAERSRHVAILLNAAWGADANKVLVIGGASVGNSAFGGLEKALDSVELYDSATGLFTTFGSKLTEPRQNHTATLLANGTIMVAGGVGSPSFSATGEIVDPSASPTPTPTPTPTPSPTVSPTPTPTPTPSPTVSPTPTPTPSPNPSPTPAPATLGNISTRLNVGTGSNVLIGGLIITGSEAKKVIIRGLGTSLGGTFTNNLANPFLELHNLEGTTIATNDDWQVGGGKQAVIDSGLEPPNAKESALVRTLQPGLYTAILRGVNSTTGIGLIEVYDLDPLANSQLGNLSTRGFVSTGSDVLIGGLIIQGDLDTSVLIRAIGPSLPITGALQDPTLELYDEDGNLLRTNDNWITNQKAILATNLAPTDDAESAIVTSLGPGLYTAIVRGVNDTTGLALVETYHLDN